MEYTNLAYVLAAILFIMGIKRLSSPKTAQSGNTIASLGMLVAIIATVISFELLDFKLIAMVTAAAGVPIARDRGGCRRCRSDAPPAPRTAPSASRLSKISVKYLADILENILENIWKIFWKFKCRRTLHRTRISSGTTHSEKIGGCW